MKRFLGIVLISISAASFGTLAIFGRLAFADGIDTFTLLFLRFTISAIIIGAILIVRHEAFPRGKTLYQLIGMGAIGYVGQSFSYVTAIKYASSGLVALLLYLYPVFVAILSTIFFREKISGTKRIALVIALTGTAFTVSPEGGQIQGILLAVAAAVIYSGYIIVGTNVMKQVTAIQSATVIFGSAGFVYFCLMLTNHPHFPASTTGWGVILCTVIIATVIPVITFLEGLLLIGPTNASMLSTLEPVVTVLLSALFFQETLKPVSIVGGLMILAAAILVTHSEFANKQPEKA